MYANYLTGEVYEEYPKDIDFDEKKGVYIEELPSILEEKYKDQIDLTNLKECIYNHQCDLELRHRILQLVALKLLYSKKTLPEIGYQRAKIFIAEFNKALGLTLSTEEIDEIMSRDYTDKKRRNRSKRKTL